MVVTVARPDTTRPLTQISGRDIVCVSVMDWDWPFWTSRQHLMSEFARTNRVLFSSIRRDFRHDYSVCGAARARSHCTLAPRSAPRHSPTNCRCGVRRRQCPQRIRPACVRSSSGLQ